MVAENKNPAHETVKPPTRPAPGKSIAAVKKPADAAPAAPATAPTPAPVSAPSAAAQPPVLSTNEQYKAHLRSLTLPKRRAVLLGNLVERIGRQRTDMASWSGAEMDEVRRMLDGASSTLRDAAGLLNSLPPEYRTRAGARRQTPVVEVKPGDIVSILDKRRSEYDGVLEPHQLTGIKVVEPRGNKVVVVLPGDVRAMLPLGHIQVAGGAANVDEDEIDDDDNDDIDID